MVDRGALLFREVGHAGEAARHGRRVEAEIGAAGEAGGGMEELDLGLEVVARGVAGGAAAVLAELDGRGRQRRGDRKVAGGRGSARS
jgi:hypothetical protein